MAQFNGEISAILMGEGTCQLVTKEHIATHANYILLLNHNYYCSIMSQSF